MYANAVDQPPSFDRINQPSSFKIDVRIEKFVVDGVEQDVFTRQTPFALEIESSEFEVRMTADNNDRGVTAVYMRQFENTWLNGGLVGKGNRLKFVLTDSTGSVGSY